jgi:hypothetical protein
MMVVQGSDDYELMPSHELDDLRREVSSLKKNSMSEGDKARVLIESMDRLTISINRLITILDDAQKDIIEEYQQSKPAEKLNEILEQNESIARALLAIHDNLMGISPAQNSPLPSQPQQQFNARPVSGGSRNLIQQPDPFSMPPQNPKPTIADNPYSMMPPSMPPMEDFPSLDDVPPLDNPAPSAPKKRFLGIG